MEILKYLFAFVLLAHGFIHLMGFAKSAGAGYMPQITQDISRAAGFAWLSTTLLFVAVAVLYFLDQQAWPYLATAAVVLSQVLIASVCEDAKFGSIANGVILAAIIIGFTLQHAGN